ncbi:hypothetical protein UA08_05902 [Talaromyces atroroseus]|uniref:Peptidase M48 domain-containing protein n=1 Tax=Talaromyces atroroseus TaxID=1441469 RepID=A0A225AD60_TALAT|nr:hypothetical protein UA08_05902 [Talaromyces atroroseus]OKL59101.1 hypothetical protein UA08_05902 [Talaromyces atroroseus]
MAKDQARRNNPFNTFKSLESSNKQRKWQHPGFRGTNLRISGAFNAHETTTTTTTTRTFRRPFSYTHSPRDNYRRFRRNDHKSWQFNYGSDHLQHRFQRVVDILSSRVVLVVAAGGLALYVMNLETVEATGRRRFNVVSASTENQFGEQHYLEVLQEYKGRILSPNHPYTILAMRVMDRLIPHIKLEGADWKVHVIQDDEMMNAFVLPSGKVFVFTGILRIAKNEDGLAAVLGHEVAHVIAHHPAERMSSGFIVWAAIMAISSLFDISGQLPSIFVNLMYSLPNSRVQEAEADRMGLMLMSESCYNPDAALQLWENMRRMEKQAPPQFISSHPSHYNRLQALRELLPEAEGRLDASGCGFTSQYYQGFQSAYDNTNCLPVFASENMSLSIPGPSQAGLFKPGYQSHDAEDGAVIRNIEACRAISQTVQSSLGPHGRNKIVINHLQKMFLTSDAATILRELDVVHPAAKLLVMASQQQDSEMGDATNLVIVFAGELLKKAEELLRMGLKTSDIVQGYEKALIFALKALEDLEVDRLKEMRSPTELSKALSTVIASKQSGSEDSLAALVAEAVLAVLPKNPANFNVDNVRVVKIMGGSLEQSRVVKGMVFGREPDGQVKKARKAKVGVFSCPIDISQTETKGTVLLKNAQEMLDFTKGEEERLEAIVKELYDSGLRVVVAGSTVGELALHYLNRFNILVVKILSKFELRRLCRVVGATPLARLGAPMPDEMGNIDVVETTEIGGDRVTVFRQEDANTVTRTATIVLRGATQNHLDDVERAIDDGVNVVKAITKDPRLVPGAGATEIQLAERISAYADKTPGLPQYAIKKYAEAFEVIPRTLAESAGLDATEVLSRLYTAHQRTKKSSSDSDEDEDSDDEEDDSENSAEDSDEDSDEEEPYWTTGVDLFSNSASGTIDALEEGILDLMASKNWAIRLATEAARTVLSVDQIIVARQAGGPKPPGQNPNWDED